MEQKLQFCVFMILVQVSLAKWQRVTAIKGDTVQFKCPVTNAHQTNMDWKNPEGYILFFKNSVNEVFPGLKSQRYKIVKLSDSEFTVSISHVTLKDGGNYTCAQYGAHTTEKTVELIVLGPPKMEQTKYKGMYHIKCTAEGNNSPPQIFWKVGHASEVPAQSQFLHRNKEHVSRAKLSLPSTDKGLTVICLIRHPALHAHHLLLDFITFKKNSKKSPEKQTTQGSTDVPQTTMSWLGHRKTTRYPHENSTDLSAVPSNEPKTDTTSEFSSKSPPSEVSPLSTDYNSRASERTTVSYGSTTHKDTNVTGGTPFFETTEEVTSYNHTETANDLNRHKGSEGGSNLLIFLVTFLIFCLMVVVIFIGIKLRKAHITWKKENEESNPSEESNKSKSSQEESTTQGQKRRGFWNTAFAHYVVEEPSVTTSAINTAAITVADSADKEQTSQPQTTEHTASICYAKETEL